VFDLEMKVRGKPVYLCINQRNAFPLGKVKSGWKLPQLTFQHLDGVVPCRRTYVRD